MSESIKSEMGELKQDLSHALVQLKDVQRQAQTLIQPVTCSPEQDLPELLNGLVERVTHLETETSALANLFLHHEEVKKSIEANLAELFKRVDSLEEERETEPMILKVVKKKRTGKKSEE